MKVSSTVVDPRYSAEGIGPTSWESVREILSNTEIYGLTTLLSDGMPHTVPVSGVVDETDLLFCTGSHEQKAKNIACDPRASIHVGSVHFFEGIDIVLRGVVERVTDEAGLRHMSTSLISKYGDFWSFDVGEGVLINAHGWPTLVFRLVPQVAYSFTRGQQTAQTRYQFQNLT